MGKKSTFHRDNGCLKIALAITNAVFKDTPTLESGLRIWIGFQDIEQDVNGFNGIYGIHLWPDLMRTCGFEDLVSQESQKPNIINAYQAD